MSRWDWRIITLVAGVLFAIQVITGWLLPLEGVFTKASLLLRPLDSNARLEAINRVLSIPEEEWNVARMKSALGNLEAALLRNPLNYRAQYDRARVLWRMEAAGEDTTDALHTAMRRTLFLRWKHREIGVAGMRFALSRWPLLTAEEQEFYRDLFSKLVGVSRAAVFRQIMETWGLYSRDMTLLESGLARKPEFYRIAAQALARFQIQPDARLNFLARYETWAVDHFRSMLQERIREGRDPYDTWKYVANKLKKIIQGYYRLVKMHSFDLGGYVKFMDQLELNMVMKLTGSMEWSRRLSSRREIQKLVGKMVARPAEPAALKQLRRRLENTRFFNQPDLEIMELRMRLLLKAGETEAATLLGASLVRERHYVPSNEADATRRIFLLYAAALERMGRGEEAMRVVAIARERTGNDLNLDWLAFRLRHPGDLDSETTVWNELPEEIRNSSNITLSKRNIVRMIYPPPQGEMVIEITEEAGDVLANAHLVQVWADGQILAERYTRTLKPGTRWKITLKKDSKQQPIRVEVRAISVK